MEKQRKVLILAHDFPPYVSIGGLRPYSWMKYFSEFDIHPIVVTRNWNDFHANENSFLEASVNQTVEQQHEPNYTLIKAPFQPSFAQRLLLKKGAAKWRFLRRIYTLVLEIMQFFLPVGSKRSIYLAANDYLKSNKVDLIIATGEPFVLFHYAKKLSERHTIPWIADYRDLWSQDISIQNTPLLPKLYRVIEKKIVKHAVAITTVSDFLVEQLKEVNGQHNYFICANGYDEIEFNENQTVTTQHLAIGFNGTIFPWYPIASLLKTLDDLWNKHQIAFELNLIGIPQQSIIKELIASDFPSILHFVTFTPPLDNKTFQVEMSKNHLLVLFNSFALMGTKIYDYLAMNRKILLLYSDDEEGNQLKHKYYPLSDSEVHSNSLQADLLAKTTAGISVKNAAELLQLLIDLNNELTTTGTIKHETTDIAAYSRKYQAERFAQFIKSQFQ